MIALSRKCSEWFKVFTTSLYFGKCKLCLVENIHTNLSENKLKTFIMSIHAPSLSSSHTYPLPHRQLH